jgi:hypothetical protein
MLRAKRRKLATDYALRSEESEALERCINDPMSNIPKEKLPLVTEVCFHLRPYGPSSYQCYDYAIKIETDPDQPELDQGRISELIEELRFTRHIANDDVADYKVVSPELTLVTGHFSKSDFDNSDPSSNDEDSSDDGHPRSDNGGSSGVEEVGNLYAK